MRKVSNYLHQQRQDTSKELRHFRKHHDKDLKECYNQVQHRLECMVYPQQGLHALPIREREPMPIIYSFAMLEGPPSHPGPSEAMRLAVEENEETLPGPRETFFVRRVARYDEESGHQEGRSGNIFENEQEDS